MKRQLWKINIFTVLLLTGINVYLLIKLLHCTEGFKENELKKNGKIEQERSQENVKNSEWKVPFQLNVGRWDSSRQYQIYEFAFTGNRFENLALNHGVCLATQSSLDRLYWLAETVDHWKGAVSVSIFLENYELTYFQEIFSHLHHCHGEFVHSLAIHVVSGRNWQPFSIKSLASKGMNCTTTASEAMDRLIKRRTDLSIKWETGHIYPQNHMRNIARKACPTDHVFLLDIDVIPSMNMVEAVSQFLRQPTVLNCMKCAFVIPTYELDVTAPFPSNKSQLLTLESQGRAQPFHQKAFRYNQFASNLTRWRQTPETSEVIISHNVTNYEFFYEPFYIARDNAPGHDERLLGYGFTRNTQVYEMTLAGWTFHVLSPIFTIHWGLQTRQRRSTWRKNQMDNNRRLFDVIHHELKVRYGQKNQIRWHAKPVNNKKAIPNKVHVQN